MKKFKHYIAVDFDSTLSTYERPFVYNKLGQPIESVIKLIRNFYEMGKYIMIFTGRMETKELVQWLKDNNVPYHSINNQPKYLELASRFKPYFSLILDDKAVNPMNRDGSYKTMEELMDECIDILKLSDRGRDEEKKNK